MVEAWIVKIKQLPQGRNKDHQLQQDKRSQQDEDDRGIPFCNNSQDNTGFGKMGQYQENIPDDQGRKGNGPYLPFRMTFLAGKVKDHPYHEQQQ